MRGLLCLILCVLLSGCSRESAPTSEPTPSPAASAESGSHAAEPHGDHTPRHGGTVYMNADLHFEIVLSRSGTHRVYFSDAARAELPASTARDVSFAWPGTGEGPGETLRAEIDESGESWVARGSAVKPLAADATIRVGFVVGGEPYWIDVPFIEAMEVGADP